MLGLIIFEQEKGYTILHPLDISKLLPLAHPPQCWTRPASDAAQRLSCVKLPWWNPDVQPVNPSSGLMFAMDSPFWCLNPHPKTLVSAHEIHMLLKFSRVLVSSRCLFSTCTWWNAHQMLNSPVHASPFPPPMTPRHEHVMCHQSAGSSITCEDVGIQQCHLHHPPVITIFIGGMFTIPSHGRFMTLF